MFLIALVPFAFALAEVVHGNGLIAAFIAGLALGNTAKEVCLNVLEFGEVEGQRLILFVFLLFGTAMVWSVLQHLTWQMVIYAFLSLTVVRGLAVAVSLLGSKLKWPSYLF